MMSSGRHRHQTQHADHRRDQPRDRERNVTRGSSTAATNAPVTAIPNEPPGSLVAYGPAFAACPPQGATIGPNTGTPFNTGGLYFPPHYCFLPPGQTDGSVVVPAPPSAGHAPPAAAVQGEPAAKPQAATVATAATPGVRQGPRHPAKQHGVNIVPTAGVAFPQRCYSAPQGHAAVGPGNADNLVAQAPHAASTTGQAVQRHPMVPTAPVAKPAVRRRKQRSKAAGRRAKKKLVAASTGRKSQGGQKSASVDTTAMSSSDSSSFSSSPSEALTTVGSSREEENKRALKKKDLLKLMHTSNLPQPPPEDEARRKRLITTLMGVAVLVGALAVTACLLALLKDSWKHGAWTDGDEETNANATIPEPQSELGSLERLGNNSFVEYEVLPNDHGLLERSETVSDHF